MVNPYAAKAHAGGGGDAFSRPAGPAQTVIPRQNRALERGDGAFAIERFFSSAVTGRRRIDALKHRWAAGEPSWLSLRGNAEALRCRPSISRCSTHTSPKWRASREQKGESCPYRQSAVRSRGRARSSYGSGMNWAICQARSSLRRDCRHARPSRPHPACRGSGELRFRSRHERSASTKTMTISITSCRGRHSAAAGRTARRQGQIALTRPAGLGLPAVFALFRASSRQERIDII